MAKPTASFKTLSVAVLTSAAICLAPLANAQNYVRGQDYLRDVIDLAEALGKTHAMRVVCNGNGDQYWRSYMISLMEYEAPYEGGLRRSMINSFNAGYSTALAAQPTCNSDAAKAEKAYAADGRIITNRLATSNIPGASLPEPGED